MPIRNLLLVCLFLLPATVQAQSKAAPIPPAAMAGVDTLAGWFRTRYPEPEARIRAVYDWVITNVRYKRQGQAAYTFEPGLDGDALLKTGVGDAPRIARLFSDVCAAAGLEAYPIDGLLRVGDLDYHAWAAVRSGTAFFLYDPALDIRQRQDGVKLPRPCFRQPGAAFLADRLPADPLWQLTDAPISYEAFRTGKPGTLPGGFRYRDSIAAYRALPPVRRLQAQYRRWAVQPGKALFQDYGTALRNAVTMQKVGNLNAVLDAAADGLDGVVAGFNAYLGHYNAHFSDQKDADLAADLRTLQRRLTAADSLYTLAAGLTNEAATLEVIQANQTQLKELKARFQRHQSFARRYLEATPAGRNTLWLTADLPD